MRIASTVPVSLVSSRMKQAPATDTATNWSVDPDHSHVGFKIRHMMVSNTNGRFRKVRGRVVLDDHHLENSQVQAVIEAASIDTDLPKRDDHLRSNEFFDVENYPHLSFASKRVEPAGPKQLMVVGDLRIKGITKERSEEHTSELQSHLNLVCRLLLEKKTRRAWEIGHAPHGAHRARDARQGARRVGQSL